MRCCAPPCTMANCTSRCGAASPIAAAWGILLADAARHVARVYAHENLLTEDAALERIRRVRGRDQRAAR